jgi:hypothetical protein
MLTKNFLASSAFAALAAAAPQYSAVPTGVPSIPDVPGYTDADASFSVTFVPAETPASVFGPDSQVAVSILASASQSTLANELEGYSHCTWLSSPTKELRCNWRH